MTCAEFQREMAVGDETGHAAAQSEHLKSCPVCSDLVADLQSIAAQAKLLVPTEDPSPRVWAGIERSLKAEGLWQAEGGPAQRAFLMTPPRTAPRWAFAAAAAVAVVAIALGIYSQRSQESPTSKAGVGIVVPGAEATLPEEDQAMMNVVTQRRGTVSQPDFRRQLANVNLYIADAQRRVAEDPNDADARDDLRRALEQKQSLYELASQEWQ
jgi:uncharacterized membrane protein